MHLAQGWLLAMSSCMQTQVHYFQMPLSLSEYMQRKEEAGNPKEQPSQVHGDVPHPTDDSKAARNLKRKCTDVDASRLSDIDESLRRKLKKPHCLPQSDQGDVGKHVASLSDGNEQRPAHLAGLKGLLPYHDNLRRFLSKLIASTCQEERLAAALEEKMQAALQSVLQAVRHSVAGPIACECCHVERPSASAQKATMDDWTRGWTRGQPGQRCHYCSFCQQLRNTTCMDPARESLRMRVIQCLQLVQNQIGISNYSKRKLEEFITKFGPVIQQGPCYIQMPPAALAGFIERCKRRLGLSIEPEHQRWHEAVAYSLTLLQAA